MLDYKAVIDFNKYTLALAAAGFVYVLEKFTPLTFGLVFVTVTFTLILFLVSILAGICLFAIATSGLHTQPESETHKSKTHSRLIKVFGITHASCVLLAMLILGILVFSQLVLTDPKPEVAPTCCCTSVAPDCADKI